MDQSAGLGADRLDSRSIFCRHDCRLGVGRWVAAVAASCKSHPQTKASELHTGTKVCNGLTLSHSGQFGLRAMAASCPLAPCSRLNRGRRDTSEHVWRDDRRAARPGPDRARTHMQLENHAFNIEVSIGSVRIRLPVAAKIALQSAGIAGGSGGSPSPVGELSVATK